MLSSSGPLAGACLWDCSGAPAMFPCKCDFLNSLVVVLFKHNSEQNPVKRQTRADVIPVST
eukprot:jgi/Botrbrau1/17077/Bobra.0285s0004.1